MDKRGITGAALAIGMLIAAACSSSDDGAADGGSAGAGGGSQNGGAAGTAAGGTGAGGGSTGGSAGSIGGSSGSSTGGSSGSSTGGSSGSAGGSTGGSGGTSSGGSSGGAGDASAGTGGTAGTGSGGSSGAGSWSSPTSLVDDLGRLAIANRVHVVGHTGGQLVHRSSADQGLNWTAPKVIAPAAGNYPGMYGGLFALGDGVYLVTAVDDMASSATAGGRQLDFRRSLDNGLTWSLPVRITKPGQGVFRMRIAANAGYVHVVGGGAPTPEGSVLYFRSTNGGATWENPVVLASNLGAYGGGQTVAVDGASVHVAYTTAVNGVGAGPTSYIRSTDNGSTWSSPLSIGENSAESSRQARVQLAAADGYVFACWQREGEFTGAPLPPDRIGYNRSTSGGASWGAALILPGDPGVDRNHQHVWMAPGGGVHLLWRIGNTTSDPAGTMSSANYGASWGPSTVAVDTGAINHPWNIVANSVTVHVITGPDGAMQYARRPLP
jgi:hypothetical protein